MYINKYGEEIIVNMAKHNLLTTDTSEYGKITKIINPFDLNITKNNPYMEPEKNKSCFLTITTNSEKILVVFKTEEDPNYFDYYFEINYDHINDKYPDLFAEGILCISLINKDNQLVLMYGTSIIILDINTFEVLKYVSSNSINRFGIKLKYENNLYIVEDDEQKITYFDENLNILN